jgi:acyl carrier protein
MSKVADYAEQLKQLVNELDIDVETDIDETSDLVNEVGLSSLQLMELVELIEDRFDVSFPLNDLADVRTLADLANAIERLTARGR